MSVKPSASSASRTKADLAVHHPGEAEHGGTGASLREGHRGIPQQRRVVVDPAVLGEDPAVAVVGELVEAQVGHHDEPVADGVDDRAQRDVEDALGVVGAGPDRVLVRRHAEQHEPAQPGLDGPVRLGDE